MGELGCCWGAQPGRGYTDMSGKDDEAGTYMQHWVSGARMEVSSWECRPNLRVRRELSMVPPAPALPAGPAASPPHPLALSRCKRKPSSPNLVNIS